MKKSGYVLFCILSFVFSFRSYGQAPVFTGGHSQSLVVCKNSLATSIDTLMKVSDTSTGHRVVWSIFAAPAHGTLVAADTLTSTGSTLTPAGITYMPAAGYSGTDVFTVEFDDSGAADTTMVTVTVDSLPNAGHLPATDSVCAGGHIRLVSGGDPGGIWHSANGVSVSVNDSGRVTGIEPGSSRISYIVTNGCGTDTVSSEVKVQIPVLPIIGGDTLCPFSLLTLIDPSAGGTWSSSNSLTAFVFGGEVAGITSGVAIISYSLTNACGTTTATMNVTVESTADCVTTSAVHTVAGAEGQLSIFPNPNNGAFTLSLSAGTNEQARVTIMNAAGEKVKEFTTATNQATEVQMDTPGGLYFVRVSTSGNVYTAKVLVGK